MADNLNILKKALKLCVVKKKTAPRSASVAYSDSGRKYLAGSVEVDSKNLSVTSEQAALILSTLAGDYGVFKIETIVSNAGTAPTATPLTLKILIDHSIRTGRKISYHILNEQGKKIFSISDVKKAFTFYRPTEKILDRVKIKDKFSSNFRKISPEEKGNIKNTLKTVSMEGLKRNFPCKEGDSGYATALITKKGNIYFGGQYSGFDKLGQHSEVSVIISALMNNDPDITHLGLVSTKHETKPCQMCGACRQFLAEISAHFGLKVKIFTFAKDNAKFKQTILEKYLPAVWTSKKTN